jgi:hypothetical protein
MTEWIDRTEALALLGVQPQTLYAYVSRGRIEVRRENTGARRSLYRAEDVAQLARRADASRKPSAIAAGSMAWGEASIITHISTVQRGRLIYRGEDAARFSASATLEDTARLLWDSKALDKNGARAVERRGIVGDPSFGVDIGGRRLLRVQIGVGEQRLGQRLEAGLARDLPFRSPLRLIGQIEVLELRLRLGLEDRPLDLALELPLLPDALENGRAALLELAQIAEPLFQRPQLRVVERAGRLLTVAGDKRHRCAAVEKLDRSLDLRLADAEFFGNAERDGFHDTTMKATGPPGNAPARAGQTEYA